MEGSLVYIVNFVSENKKECNCACEEGMEREREGSMEGGRWKEERGREKERAFIFL